MLEVKCQENSRAIAQQMTSGGSGADVSVTQVLSSGTKIATIEVDDVSTDLYCETVPATYDADDVNYDNTTSGLTATDVQGAIDEIVQEISDISYDYSTTEHIIGKWVDGTTDVYEKTQNGGITFDGSNLQDTSFTNVDKIISVSGSVLRGGEPVALGYFNTSLATSWLCRDNTIKVMVANNTEGEVITFDNMTVRYTKVSTP